MANDLALEKTVASESSLSLVIPVYNESQGIMETLDISIRVLEEIGSDYEIVIVDDGSNDGTWEVVMKLADQDQHIKLVRFSRNFGKEAAILAGLENCRGEAVIVMDGDLQHPPELMKEMVRLWKEEGYIVVHGVKESRQNETCSRGFLAKIFYALMTALSGYDLKGGTDYKLLDRSVVGQYVKLPEKVRFFRGLIPWLGYKSISVTFSPGDRIKGSSGWSLFSLVRLGVRAICAFSSLPMQVVSILGGIMFVSSLLLGLQTIYMKFSGKAVAGFATVIILLLFIGSILMISLGLIGQYLAMIYEEIKGRPAFIIEKTRNL